ncbi:MAG: helix-turn-helix domain-containing protein [Gaiellales bacterium]
MGDVYDLQLPHNLQSVLLALADHADHSGGNAYPSVALLAWKTGYTERNIQLLLRQLEGRAILVQQRAPGRHRPRTYRIVLSAGVRKAPFRRRGRGENISPISAPKDESHGRRGEISTARGEVTSRPNRPPGIVLMNRPPVLYRERPATASWRV